MSDVGKKPVLVQKFGGSSVADADGFRACVEIITQHAQDYRVGVVVSAVYGVTDLLESAITEASRGQGVSQQLNQVRHLHQQLLTDLGVQLNNPANQQLLDETLKTIEERIQGVVLLQRCPDSTRAEILVCGELLSSRILVALLRASQTAAQWLDPAVLVVAKVDYLDAVIDIEASAKPLKEHWLAEQQVAVLPGFCAKNRAGEWLTLGRNGSDYSAAALAASLLAKRCQIWKDVDGIYSADPRLVRDARRLTRVSYAEAMELSYFGAKVIGAKALAPLLSYQIPCEIRNTFAPANPGTLISSQQTVRQQHQLTVVKGVTHLDHVASLTIHGPGMRGQVGIAQRVMETLAKQDISLLLIVQSSSESSITLCVPTGKAARAERALREAFHFERLHGLIDEIVCRAERAIVSLVGDGMKQQRGIAARFLTAVSVAGANVEVIAQGSTESAIAVVVDRADAQATVRACHTAFFSESAHIDVVVMGCGNVGAALLEQFQRQQPALKQQRLEVRVRAIANSRQLYAPGQAIDLSTWQARLAEHGRAYQQDDVRQLKDQLGLLNPCLIDCTTNPDLAGSYVEFLQAGFHVVTANKKANTENMAYYHALRQAAASNLRNFLYETNVGAGLPVIDTLKSLLRSGDELRAFAGILSGSLSMIFGLLEDGETFSTAVAKAMELGYTEPDPRDDLSGMDVARKLLIIAREVGYELELDQVEVEPVIPPGFAAGVAIDQLGHSLSKLDASFADKVAVAKADNSVLRYVGSIEQGRCRVGIEAVPQDQPLHTIRDGENALALHTRYYQPRPLVLRGYGAGAAVTAAGVFGDLLRTVWRPLDRASHD